MPAVSLCNGQYSSKENLTDFADARGLRAQRLQVPLPKEDSQLGFFFPTTTPILVFLITR